MRHSMKRHAAVPFLLAPLAVALSGGCLPEPDPVEVNAPLPSFVGCAADERAEGNDCVPKLFDQAVIPPPTSAADIAREGDKAYVKSTLLVFFRGETTSVAEATAVVGPQGGEVVGAIPFAGMFRVRFATAPGIADLSAKIAVLGANPAISAVMLDTVLPASALNAVPKPDNDFDKVKELAPYDDFFDGSPHNFPSDLRRPHELMGAPEAWSAIYDANVPLSPVVIAVLDGFAAPQPTFAGLPLRGARDLRPTGFFTADTTNPKHGTAVASVIGAPNDGRGTNGIVSGVPKEGGGSCVPYDLAPIAVAAQWTAQALDTGTPTDAILFGLVVAVTTSARVVNLSMGSDYAAEEGNRAALADTVRRIATGAPKTLFVLTAGNADIDAKTVWPGSSARTDEPRKPPPNIMTVAAVDNTDHQAKWTAPAASGYDKTSTGAVTIAAPGTAIVAEAPNGNLTTFLGTSAAAPLVSGAAALLFSLDKKKTGGQVRDLLVRGGDDLPPAAFPAGPGGKRINIGRSVNFLLEEIRESAIILGAAKSPFGSGNCRKDDTPTPTLDACRKVLDPKWDDVIDWKLFFSYDLKVTGTIDAKPFTAEATLRIDNACRDRSTHGLSFSVIKSSLNLDSIGSASCSDYVGFTPDGGQIGCAVLDPGYAPGKTASIATPPPGKTDCTVRCPKEPQKTEGVDVKVTGGTLDFTFSQDCTSVSGKWKPEGTCGYDITFTGTYKPL